MSNQPLKIIFASTPDFGIPALRKIAEDKDFEIVAVITQPDKPVGRKQVLTPPPIKTEALKLNLPILQPDKISEIKEEIKKLKPELIVAIAYRQLIPEDILKIPQYGCLNIHSSLLPKYRGASCVQAQILNGEAEAGVTIMKIDAGLDTGPILKQLEIKLKQTETAGELYHELFQLGAEILAPTIKDYIAGKITPQAQDNSQATYTKELKKSDGLIDWAKNAEEIERFVRAMNPWPVAFTKTTNYQLPTTNLIKIIRAEREILKINKYSPGELFVFEKKLAVQCGRDALIIKKIQPEGKKEMSGEEFLNGYKDLIN